MTTTIPEVLEDQCYEALSAVHTVKTGQAHPLDDRMYHAMLVTDPDGKLIYLAFYPEGLEIVRVTFGETQVQYDNRFFVFDDPGFFEATETRLASYGITLHWPEEEAAT